MCVERAFDIRPRKTFSFGILCGSLFVPVRPMNCVSMNTEYRVNPGMPGYGTRSARPALGSPFCGLAGGAAGFGAKPCILVCNPTRCPNPPVDSWRGREDDETGEAHQATTLPEEDPCRHRHGAGCGPDDAGPAYLPVLDARGGQAGAARAEARCRRWHRLGGPWEGSDGRSDGQSRSLLEIVSTSGVLMHAASRASKGGGGGGGAKGGAKGGSKGGGKVDQRVQEGASTTKRAAATAIVSWYLSPRMGKGREVQKAARVQREVVVEAQREAQRGAVVAVAERLVDFCSSSWHVARGVREEIPHFLFNFKNQADRHVLRSKSEVHTKPLGEVAEVPPRVAEVPPRVVEVPPRVAEVLGAGGCCSRCKEVRLRQDLGAMPVKLTY